MNVTRLRSARRRGREEAATLAEVMVAALVLSIVLVALYVGISSGLSVIQLTRENLRATQILTEKMEIVRLCSWEQVTAPTNFIPSTFSAPFDSNGSTNGLVYTGTVRISDPTMAEFYKNHLKLIQIELTWTSGSVQRTRSMSTYVSEYGLQNYVY